MWKAESEHNDVLKAYQSNPFELPGPENGGRIFLRNVGNHLSRLCLSHKTKRNEHYKNPVSRNLVRRSMIRNVRQDFIWVGASLAASTII